MMLLHYHGFHTKRLAFAMTDLRRRLDDSVSDVWTWTPTWTMMLLQCRKFHTKRMASAMADHLANLVYGFD